MAFVLTKLRISAIIRGYLFSSISYVHKLLKYAIMNVIMNSHPDGCAFFVKGDI